MFLKGKPCYHIYSKIGGGGGGGGGGLYFVDQPLVSLKQNIGMNFKDNVETAFTHEICEGFEWGIHQVVFMHSNNWRTIAHLPYICNDHISAAISLCRLNTSQLNKLLGGYQELYIAIGFLYSSILHLNLPIYLHMV